MPKMPWALRHPFPTRLTLEITVNRAHAGVHQSTHLWLVSSFVHDLRVLDLCDRVRFLRVGKTWKNSTHSEVGETTRATYDFLG